MKRPLVVALLFALAAPAAHAAAPPLVPRDLTPLAGESHALLQIAAGPREAAAVEALRRAGAARVSDSLGVWRLPSAVAARLAPALALDGALLDVEPDYPRAPLDHLGAGDPLLPQQWWIGRIGADRVEPPGPGVPLTIVDGGVDTGHPEFAERPDTSALNPQTIVTQSDFHGTAVASVAAAPANGVGIVGVYPRARLLLWDASPARNLTTANIVQGIEAAARLGRGVVNLSLGGVFPSRIEELAVMHAYDRGVLVVAASGNERQQGARPSYPASYPHVLTVGAVDAADRLASFSSPSPGMDLVAPGVSIAAALPTALEPSGYAPVDGTSFAAPLVAGAAAWVWTQRPDLDKTQLFELMRRSARPLAPARNPDTGFGLLDVPRALTMPPPPRDPFEPNDTLDQVIPGRHFATGRPGLTRPGVGRNVVNARLDVTDDPRDVWRVWVPRNGRVLVTLTGPQAVELRWAGPTAVRRQSRLAPRRLELVNRTAAGQWTYVTALIRPAAQPSHAAYRLTLATTPAPARR